MSGASGRRALVTGGAGFIGSHPVDAPRQSADGDYAAVIPRFVQACRSGAAPRITGDGEQTRDFVFVADAARANRLAAGAVEAVHDPARPGEARRSSADLRRARELLGFEAPTSPRQGLEQLLLEAGRGRAA